MMNIITKDKTTSLVKIAHNTDKLIVCFNTEEAHRVHRFSVAHGYNIHLPITFNELLYGRYSHHNIDELLIDNIDELFFSITKGKCKTFTISDEILKSLK